MGWIITPNLGHSVANERSQVPGEAELCESLSSDVSPRMLKANPRLSLIKHHKQLPPPWNSPTQNSDL